MLTPIDTSDYDCGPPRTYTFTASAIEFTVRCVITNDAVTEDTEMFTVSITSAQNVTLSPATALVEIADDDSQCICVCECVHVCVGDCVV